MIHVIAAIRIKDGRVAEFIEIFKANVPNVLKEEGCIAYEPTMDVVTGLPPQQLDANTVTIVEQWRSLEHLKAHLTAPHMVTYQQQVKEMVEEISLKVLAGV